MWDSVLDIQFSFFRKTLLGKQIISPNTDENIEGKQ